MDVDLSQYDGTIAMCVDTYFPQRVENPMHRVGIILPVPVNEERARYGLASLSDFHAATYMVLAQESILDIQTQPHLQIKMGGKKFSRLEPPWGKYEGKELEKVLQLLKANEERILVIKKQAPKNRNLMDSPLYGWMPPVSNLPPL